MGVQWFFSREDQKFLRLVWVNFIIIQYTFDLTWAHNELVKLEGKNAHVYVYVYGYKVRLHVYENCVNVAALRKIAGEVVVNLAWSDAVVVTLAQVYYDDVTGCIAAKSFPHLCFSKTVVLFS